MNPARVPIWCEIVCRLCGMTIAGQFTYGSTPRNSMKREALKAGWGLSIFERESLDWICCECIKKRAVRSGD